LVFVIRAELKCRFKLRINGIIVTVGGGSTRRITFPIANLSTTNYTYTGLGSSLILRGESAVTNHLVHGMVLEHVIPH
jgi:hypothetical protein